VYVCGSDSPNNIRGVRRPKNIKFGTKAAFSKRMIRTLKIFGKNFKNCGKLTNKTIICKNPTKFSKSNSRNAEIGTNIV